jgi:hypothetical protein
MLKYVLIVALAVVLLVSGVFGYMSYIDNKKQTTISSLVQTALDASKEYSNGYRGKADVSKLNKALVSEDVVGVITKFQNDLKSHDEMLFNVSDFFFNYGEERELGVIKNSESGEVLRSNGRPDDKRIFYKDDIAYIRYADLDPEGTGLLSINYKGVELKSEVPEKYKTFSQIVDNPENIYNYFTHQYVSSTNGDYIEVIYVSAIKGDKFLNFKFLIKGGKLSTLEVKG